MIDYNYHTTWRYKDPGQISRPSSINVFIFTGSLQIKSSEEKDHGRYECVAENSIGTDYSKHALLYVKGM